MEQFRHIPPLSVQSLAAIPGYAKMGIIFAIAALGLLVSQDEPNKSTRMVSILVLVAFINAHQFRRFPPIN